MCLVQRRLATFLIGIFDMLIRRQSLNGTSKNGKLKNCGSPGLYGLFKGQANAENLHKMIKLFKFPKK